MRTLILFLSEYKSQPEEQYSTDQNFKVMGAQTNEAPVRYAITRLKRSGQKLNRIIALVTPKARETTALERFKEAIHKDSPEIDIDDICIPDSVTTTELLRKTLEKLLPIAQSDSVIIETTGGFRNAVNALTLLTRFLRYNGISIDFSTYSDLGSKHVSVTKETDHLFLLLDATNIFAVYANPRPLLDAIRKAKIPHKAIFEKAIRDFYDVMLCCKTSKLDNAMKNLRDAMENVINAEYEPEDTVALVFHDLISELVRTKLAFITADEYLLPLIRWCCENGYLMQAVIIFVEKVLTDKMEYNTQSGKFDRNKSVIGKRVGDRYWKFIKYRDDFAHADLEKSNATAEEIKKDLLDTIDEIEKDPFIKPLFVLKGCV